MDIHNLCKFTVLLLRPSLRSLDFPLFLVMDDAVSAVKQKLYADREKLTILVNNNHQEGGRVCVCVWAWAWLYPCQHVRCFNVYNDSTLGKKLVQRNTDHKLLHIHVHDECMKTLTTVVLFQLNLYTAYIFHTGVKGERKRKTARGDQTQSIKQLSHQSSFPGCLCESECDCTTLWHILVLHGWSYIFNPPQYREQLQFNMHGSWSKVSIAIY